MLVPEAPVGVGRVMSALQRRAVAAHVVFGAKCHAIELLHPALQRVGMVHPLHLVLAYHGAAQRPMQVVLIAGLLGPYQPVARRLRAAQAVVSIVVVAVTQLGGR